MRERWPDARRQPSQSQAILPPAVDRSSTPEVEVARDPHARTHDKLCVDADDQEPGRSAAVGPGRRVTGALIPSRFGATGSISTPADHEGEMNSGPAAGGDRRLGTFRLAPTPLGFLLHRLAADRAAELACVVWKGPGAV